MHVQGHGHDHGHSHQKHHRAFALGVAMNAVYIVIEAGYGIAIGSLALLADAGHNLSDVVGLLLAWGAHYLGGAMPTVRRTYGWRSSSILAALLNAVILLMAVGGIAWEATQRLWQPSPVTGLTVIVVAGVGTVVNTLTALLFMKGGERDLNIRGAFLHMAADAGVSIAVMLGGVVMLVFGWFWVDPLLSLVIAGVIFIGTWNLLTESINLALHAVPKGIDPEAVEQFLATRPGVQAVHDLHIWAMSTTETALTAHLVMPGIEVGRMDAFLVDTAEMLRQEYHIGHSTLQIETGRSDESCSLQSPQVV